MKIGVLALPLAALALTAVAGCQFPQGFGQGAGANAPQSSGGSSGSSPQEAAASESSPSAAPSAPIPTSVDAHNDCPQTVKLFLGSGDGKPGFSSGTQTSIGSNTTTTFPRGPDGSVTIWIIDDSENGITNLKVTPDISKVSINCTTITAG
jgi:hypothetical protein